MGNLTNAGAIKALKNITTTGDDGLLETLAAEATAIIEGYTQRSFEAVPGTLVLDAAYPTVTERTLFFGQDMVSVASVTNGDGTVIPSTAYRLLPANASPKYGVELKSGAAYAWTQGTDGPEGAITVVGSLGFCYEGDRPQDVIGAATKLAAWLYDNRDNKGERVQLADGTSILPSEAPAMVMRVLSRYVRTRFTS